MLPLFIIGIGFIPQAFSETEYAESQVLVAGSPRPVGIAVDIAGTVYWVNYDLGQLLALTKGAKFPILMLSGLNHPQDVAVDASGNIYFTEFLRGTISVLPAGSNSPSILLSGLNYPTAISADAVGNLFFITGTREWHTCGEKIVRFDNTSKTLETLLTLPGPAEPGRGFGDISIHSSGDLYYSTCRVGTIERLPRWSATPEVLLNTTQATLGLAVETDGDIFFTDYSYEVNMLAKGSTIPVPLNSKGASHYLIALDSESNIYYSDDIDGLIWIIPKISATTTAISTSSASTTSTTISPTTISPTSTTPTSTTSTTSIVATSITTTTVTSTIQTRSTITTTATTQTSITVTSPVTITETRTQMETQTTTTSQLFATTATVNQPSNIIVAETGLFYVSIGLAVLGVAIAIGLIIRTRGGAPKESQQN